jgi:hypothetical protein
MLQETRLEYIINGNALYIPENLTEKPDLFLFSVITCVVILIYYILLL